MSILGISSAGETKDFFAVVQRLQWLADELELLRERLRIAGHAPDIVGPPLGKVEMALSPRLLLRQAAHVKQVLSDEVLTSLAFCSLLLPEDEEALAIGDFEEIVGLISSLEMFLSSANLPGDLVNSIRRHIRAAELALAAYPIRGARALKESVQGAAGYLMDEGDEIDAVSPETALALRQLWQKINDVADAAIKIDALLQIASRISKFPA